MTAKDRRALVRWWQTGTPAGLKRAVVRRLKASRYATVTRNGLVLTLARTNLAARWAAWYGAREAGP